MSRLSRAELQLHNRAKVLAAARTEFAEHGYRDATVDRIAARADLTRGAVYSNFPGKRALYFSTLIPTPRRAAFRPSASASEGLAAFALAWLGHEHPDSDAVDVGTPYAGLLDLNAVLLGVSLDQLEPGRLGRMIGIGRLTLALLTGAGALGPAFVQPLAVARACAHLTSLDPPDPWVPPPTTPPVRPADEEADFDGIVAVLGLDRLTAVEDAVRTTTAPTTIALVSSSPHELGPLARYTTGTLLDCLQQSLPMPRVRIVHDEDGVLASAVGCDVIGDGLEYAVSVVDGRIVARAEGFGAARAIAARHAALL